MRKQTKRMLDLLLNLGTTNDREADRRGIDNPRREAAIINSHTAHEVRIKKESATKRKYTLMEEI